MNPPKRPLKAKCPANQAALDRLGEKRAKVQPSSNFSFTLARAFTSLMNTKDPVVTEKDALALQYVGPAIAKIIVPPEQKNNKKARATKSQTDNTSTATSNSSVTSKDKPKAKRKRPPPAATVTFKTTKSAKELAYEKAHKEALDYKTLPCWLNWRVVLVIDGRERMSDHMQAKCQMSGIPTEERHLPIGDMAWIAQGFAGGTSTSSKQKIKVELVLGTIIERKTMEDFKSSLFGTRYAEQRLRLQETGCPQVLYLVEGDMNKEQFRCPADTLHSATWETRLHCGFSIVNTAHMDDTVRTLKRMHRRILQRTFPAAFRQEALPTFEEANARGVRRQDNSTPDRQRRRRRRLQSLMELTFDIDPTPPFGLERFLTYNEVKAKVEWDREMGTRTVGNIHRAMLKQVPTCSAKKCNAIANLYPTASHLLQAYDEVPGVAARKSLVADIVTSDASKSARDLKIGPRSASELYVAYGVKDEEAEEEETPSSRKEVPSQGVVPVPEAAPKIGIARKPTTSYSPSVDDSLSTKPSKRKSPPSSQESVKSRRKWSPSPSPPTAGASGCRLDDTWQYDEDHGVGNSFWEDSSSPAAGLENFPPGNDVIVLTDGEEDSKPAAKSTIMDISFASSVDISPPRFPLNRKAEGSRMDDSDAKTKEGSFASPLYLDESPVRPKPQNVKKDAIEVIEIE